jgi:hypothetical protein
MKERGEERFANEGDFATLLDRSATRVKHLGGGGPHDYHGGAARSNVGFGTPEYTERPGAADASYRSISVPQVKPPVSQQ